MSARQVQCRITRIRPLTSTVRQVMLSVESDIEIKHAKFKPGQWVDFFPPQYKNPGGFSISSSPDLLPDIELAIRASPHPVVQWVFDQAKVDDIVQIAIGGEWYLKRRKPHQTRLLLVAGGVGINPILAMLRHLAHMDDAWRRIDLVYSARNWDDILYKEEVLELMRHLPQLHATIHLTDSDVIESASPVDRVRVQSGRIEKEHLTRISGEDTVAYLCGPPLLSEALSEVLTGTVDEVNFEKWW